MPCCHTHEIMELIGIPQFRDFEGFTILMVHLLLHKYAPLFKCQICFVQKFSLSTQPLESTRVFALVLDLMTVMVKHQKQQKQC